MTPANVLAQVASPDPVGVSLALFRMRVYRFSDDLRLYVLAEWLEERFVQGHKPRADTLAYVERSVQQIRDDGTPLPYDESVAVAEQLDIDSQLHQRHQHTKTSAAQDIQLDQIVFIVGAPRSGTSHLYNLLAHTGRFAYFTTVSCWAWPTRNLARPEQCSFEHLNRRVFDLDNKATRIVPALAVPHEAEDLYARAIPTYEHRHGHAYRLRPPSQRDPDLLRHAVRAHLGHFGRHVLLTKSPFNSLRIEALEAIWGTKARYLHIVRDPDEVANSMRRNRFQFAFAAQPLTEDEACAVFTAAVSNQAPSDRLLTVAFEQLQTEPESTITNVLTWLHSPHHPGLPSQDS